MISCYGLLQATEGDYKEPIERSFEVAGRPLLVLQNSDGTIHLNGWEQKTVHVIATKQVTGARNTTEAKRAADKVHIEFERVGNQIRVETKYPMQMFSFGGPRVSVRFEVKAPISSDIQASVSDGEMEVAGLQGKIDLSASDGNVSAGQCTGEISLSASDGNLHADHLSGNLTVRLSDGDLLAENCSGNLQMRGGDGHMEIRAFDGSQKSRMVIFL